MGDGTKIDGVVLKSNRHKILQVVSSLNSFAALLANGKVAPWGGWHGGDSTGVDFDGENNNLKVTKLFSNEIGFSALRRDG